MPGGAEGFLGLWTRSWGAKGSLHEWRAPLSLHEA